MLTDTDTLARLMEHLEHRATLADEALRKAETERDVCQSLLAEARTIVQARKK